MSAVQHREAHRLLKIIETSDGDGTLLTYQLAAEALGRDRSTHARAIAQMCDLLDAAAALAGVPLLALVKIRDAAGNINSQAWRSRTSRHEIIANSLNHTFTKNDYQDIEKALLQLSGLGN